MIHGVFSGRKHHVFPGGVGPPEGLGVEPQIEMSIATGVAAGRLRRSISGGDYGVGSA